MMAMSSLAAQLQKLQTPQTARFLENDKKRASLLFNPKEAANLDRETVFNIGKNGLDELIKLSVVFKDFEDTLFAQSSIHLERSIHDAKLNKSLNKQIEKFLILLSPYFLLSTAHKALEWLIYRYKIHEYNKDHYMLLILPYHETRMFIRALQLVDVSANRDKWNWLKPLQKPGIPLSSLTLVNRLTVDNGLLELLSNHVSLATSIYQDKANCLNILYAFYTIAVVGSIERSKKISEIQVNHILPTLMNSLESAIPDFAGSGIMILSRLSIKQRLNNETMTHLLLKALKNPVLKHELIMLIFFLYEAPNNEMKYVPLEVVEKISEYTWLCDEIIKVKNCGIEIIPFIVPFLETSIKAVLKNSNGMENIKSTVIKIFEKIVFDEYEVDAILKDTLKPNLTSEALCDDSQSFLSRIYGILEVRYANCFDEYLKNLMKQSESCIESKKSLQFLMSWHSGAKRAQNSLNAFDKLNNFVAEYRISALNDLAAGKIDIADGFEGMVKKSIIERFNDDNVDVVKALLNFPIKRLKSLFPSDNLIERLMILLSQCHTEKKHVLAKPALKLLLDLCDDGDDTSVFLAILPYLFPTSDEEVDIALQILNSEFSKKNQYLQDVRKEIYEDATAKSIGDAAFHSLMSSGLFPPTENIITTMKLSSNYDATSLFFNLVLLGSVCRRKIGEISHKKFCEMIEMAADMIKRYPKVKPIPGCNHLTNEQIQPALELTSKGILPLQAGTYVLEMVFRRLDLKSTLLDFENNSDLTKLVMCIFEFILEGINSSYADKKRHYSWVLKIFVQRHFHTTEALMEFLSQGFILPVKPQTSFQCLRMALAMFDRLQSVQWIFEKKIFVTNLIIALSRENKTCREAAVDVLKRLFQTFNLNKMNGISSLLAELYKKTSEISIDHEQISLILYNLLSPDPDVSSQLTKTLQQQMKEAREFLFNITLDENIPIHIKAQLLDVLSHVNGVDVMEKLTPRGLQLMEIVEKNSNDDDNNDAIDDNDSLLFTKIALKNILYRFNSTTVNALKTNNVWKLFELSLSNNKLLIPTENGKQLPSTIIIKQIDDIFFDNAGKIQQKKILSKFVDIVTDCEINNVVASANKAVQRIKINAQLIVDELEKMKNAKLPDEIGKTLTGARAKRRSKLLEMTKRPELINTHEWKRGITILEFIQRAENIDNENLLVPVLFDLLRMCLSFEEQSPLEYTNQLLLSTIYNLAIKNLPIPNAHLQVDLISQCIRTSQNPQTHHHALLVLVELFKIADIEIALNNIMPIFTFMGSSVLRQDDAYSIQIISKTIETIVPIINASNDEKHACEILRIFVVSLPDIPEHRRIPLFIKLLQLLNHHLHLFYLLTFEADVLCPNKEKTDNKITQRLEFALTISQEFTPKKIIDVCVELAKFFKSLPIEIDDDEVNIKTIQQYKNKHIFDVYKNTPKQLRHYKYIILQFLSNLLSSIDFINRVAIMSEEETNDLKLSYDNLIIEIIILIQATSKNADKHQGKSKGKYWKVLVHSLYDILDAINNLLPNQVFILTLKKLIDHDHLTVRKKALELLNSRLQHKKFNEEDQQSLLTLIIPLLQIISKRGKILSQEVENIQQTSLITLKLLAKNLAQENPAYFKPVLELTTEFLKKKEGLLLASVVLCVAELVGTMKTHAIPLINKFVPSIINLLKKYCHQDSTPDVLVISIVSALQKIVESLGNFFSLYLDQLLCELCRLNTRYTDIENSKTAIIVSKVKATSQKLASCISLRVMLPAVNKTYTNMLETKSYKSIPSLMFIFSECFGYLPTSDLQTALPELANFFLRVLQFRENLNNNQAEEKKEAEEEDEQMEISNDDDDNILNDIKAIEESAGKSLVNLVLKLSEALFRPFYYKLYDWAARNPDKKLRSITFYRLSTNIAESLKSLFVLFAGHFLTHAAQLLSHNNLEIRDDIGEHTLELEINRIELIESILSTLNKVFSYDANNFVNQERFDTLCQPIVDQIENTVGTKKQYEIRADKLIVPCIASFSSAIQDDSLHKSLVYQVLLKTRHNKSSVRSTALSAIVEIARKLGQDFMPLLPETVPFLAELLEDEDADTEKLAQNAVRTLEEVLGENLQKYF
ncbi:HEAT repeat-containing protein 1 [Aphidius gifuensis]|uniref:HEAT repeat-containing protein 1 n=1 Tax=Aphidius gifuensis TaxID=684658 RepID=UPI001CDB6DAA|nr:HEAT repeat-containing protein 1 [Aphidius gifuensis]